MLLIQYILAHVLVYNEYLLYLTRTTIGNIIMATTVLHEEISIEKLSPSSQNIAEWFERFEVLMEMKLLIVPAISEEEPIVTQEMVTAAELKQTSYFIASLTPDMYSLVRSYITPLKVNSQSYEGLKKVVEDYLAPKPTILAERYRFYNTFQASEDKAATYLSKLRTTATKCNFETSFDESVMVQFICGLHDERTRKHLLSEDLSKLTINTAFEKVATRERAKHEAQIMSHGTNNVNVVGVQKRRQHSSGSPNLVLKCSQCTLQGHTVRDCYTVCHKCSVKGHIRKNCPTMKKGKFQYKSKKKSKLEICRV